MPRTRFFTRLLAATALLAVGACAERAPVAPVEQQDARGEVVSSSWSLDDSGSLRYDGTFSTNVSVEGKTAEARSLGDAREMSISPSERTRLEAALPDFRLPTPPEGAAEPTLRVRGEGGGGSTASRGPKTFNRVMPDGRHMRAEFLGGGDRHPPRVVSIFIDGRLRILTNNRYRKNEFGRWQPTWTRITTFDENGTVVNVTEHDMSGVKAGPRRIGAVLGDALRDGCAKLAGLVGPTALSAQFLECNSEQQALFMAASYYDLSSVALAMAAKPCVTGAGCLALAVAIANEVLAAVALSWATSNLDACHDAILNGEPTPEPVTPGGGLSETGYCILLIHEISYNGGATWYEVGREIVCGA